MVDDSNSLLNVRTNTVMNCFYDTTFKRSDKLDGMNEWTNERTNKRPHQLARGPGKPFRILLVACVSARRQPHPYPLQGLRTSTGSNEWQSNGRSIMVRYFRMIQRVTTWLPNGMLPVFLACFLGNGGRERRSALCREVRVEENGRGHL